MLLLARVLLTTAISVAAATPAAQKPVVRTVALDDSGWRLSGDLRVDQVLGRNALRCGSGTAYLHEHRFRDGTIEFDVATTRARTFVGVRFRAATDQIWEEIYFRPHKAGLPDTIQYAPAFAAAVSNWQLYHGPGESAAAELAANRWTHVKVTFHGTRAVVYLDNAKMPAMVSELAHEPREGYMGFWCLDAREPKGDGFAAAISNVTITPGATHSELPPPLPGPSIPPGVIERWQVSAGFAAPPSGPVLALPDAIRRGEWRAALVDRSGLLAFDRFVGRPAGVRRVAAAARVTIDAEEAHTVPFEFGYSDDASVFLNGTLLFSGVAGYSYNFPRRDGLITIDQSTLYLPLTAGANELLVVVSEAFGGWGLMGRLAEF
jgi:hypothetical protein